MNGAWNSYDVVMYCEWCIHVERKLARNAAAIPPTGIAVETLKHYIREHFRSFNCGWNHVPRCVYTRNQSINYFGFNDV